MQLDLFADNRPGILLNIADEFIRSGNLDQAVSVYEQLLDEYPDDTRTPPLLGLVSQWRDLLSRIAPQAADPLHLREIWIRIESLSHPALRSTVLKTLVDALEALPDAAQIYVQPRFHLGHVLMEAGSFAEAAECFQTAISGNEIPRGRFLAWRGDALTLAGNGDDALKCYLAAFLDDPFSVEMHSVKNRTIHLLHTSLSFEAADGIDEEEEPAWLPVWGWLQGVFPLPLQATPETDIPGAAEFESRLAEDNCSVPRLWFEMLTQAERLRVVSRNDRELAAMRRLMKGSNGFMFDCYLDKLRRVRV